MKNWEPHKEPEREDFECFEVCDSVPRLVLLLLAGLFLGTVLFEAVRNIGHEEKTENREMLP